MIESNSLPPKFRQILELLEQHGEMRIEEIADRQDLEFTEAKRLVHKLWDQNLVVSGTNFEFSSDVGESISNGPLTTD